METVPLASMDYVSENTSSGQGFTRLIAYSAQNYPFFLIPENGSNSIVSAQFSVKSANSQQFSGAIEGLSAVQSVAKIVSPQSNLLTQLTAQSNQNLANALDQAVSQLFSTSIDEESLEDADIGRFVDHDKEDNPGIAVTLKIPDSEGNVLEKPTDVVGLWYITFDQPRPSIFSPITLCDPQVASVVDLSECHIGSNTSPPLGDSKAVSQAYATAAGLVEKQAIPSDVLTYILSGQAQSAETIGTYISKQTWYTQALTKFQSDDAADIASDADDFCRNIKNTITQLGLNSVDAGIVVRAVADGTPAIKSDAVQQIDQELSDTDKPCSYVYPMGP